MHPEYAWTAFRVDALPAAWPRSFIIITGWATTGEQWTAAANAAANARLEAVLGAIGAWSWPITGYSPRTGHAEPGWAVELDLEAGLSLGREFVQQAIFEVVDDLLRVWACDTDPPDGQLLGRFSSRVGIAA
ncbi:MAG: hypothetical protein RL026_327 [Pseudomonadota bacterium]|jgi:hypothetical protein